MNTLTKATGQVLYSYEIRYSFQQPSIFKIRPVRLRAVKVAWLTQQEGTAWGGNQLSASWYTPALPLGHVKLLLNDWSVSEFSKLVQLNSGLLGNSILFPQEQTSVCRLLRAVPG